MKNLAALFLVLFVCIASAQTVPAGCQNIIWQGAVPDGVTDNTAAWNAAVRASDPNQICVYFPPGHYRFAWPMAYTFQTAAASSITILGAGQDITNLEFSLANAPGIAIGVTSAFNSVHIRDLTVAAKMAQGSQGILLSSSEVTNPNPANTAPSDVINVTVRGSDGYIVNNGWQYDVYLYTVSNINFINDNFLGPYTSTAVQLVGTATNIGVVYNFIGDTFNGTNYGITYGQYIQGVTVVNSNFNGNQNGIYSPPGGDGEDQLTVLSSQFNAAQNGILLQSPIEATMIEGNFFLVNNNSAGINLQNYAGAVISGNYFSPAVLPAVNQIGVKFSSYASQASIVGNNVFQQITTPIVLSPTSQYVNVQSNAYWRNINPNSNAGTNNTLGGGSQ
ncbi:hypothetical protein F0160_22740 [Paraburkholderia sp. JPY303]|uniref:glycosyl hydrolase family 28-related protein n=1 Tax=Paraburkholderia atlantica TaxID=2654982 RepID=UPI00159136D0|nr:glycosyl hydrolase family 28-related protein [Paraburkholderia atlantica]NUY33306.1 hypothetical protein [Paraburkholderia atlantica]